MVALTLVFVVLLDLLSTGICCRKYVPDVDSDEMEEPVIQASLNLPVFENRPVTNYIRHQRNVENRCTCGVTMPSLKSNPTGRVYGGSDAERNEFPFQVALALKNSRVSICGGSLINSHFVLTAAHCVIDTQGGVAYYAIKKLKDLQILLGAHDLNKPDEVFQTLRQGKRLTAQQIKDADEDGVVRRDVAEIFVHPGYTLSLSSFQTKQIEDDVALIRLARPVRLPHPRIWTSCLPMSDDHDFFPNVNGLIIGWGFTKFQNDLSLAERLQKLEIPIQSLDFCRSRAKINISDNFICISSLTRERDAGQGDSGGPLLVRNTNVSTTSTKIQYIQVGLASFQNTVGFQTSPNAYSVYARVGEYLPWIYSLTDAETQKQIGTPTPVTWCKTEL